MIDSTPVKRRRPRSGEGSIKSSSYTYSVLNNGVKINVCREAFINLHGVTVKRVKRLCSLLTRGTSPKDKRGKHRNTREMPGEELQRINAHISSFPVHESHYSGKEKYYLDARLNVKKMYALFQEKYPQSKVSYKYYAKYFRENFTLCFGQPQIDTCCTCEELNVKIKNPRLNDVAKRVAVTEKMVHEAKAKKFHTQTKLVKEMCEKDNSIGGIVIDYMQNLPLPHIPVQEMFYLRQLWVYVFNIHDLKTGKSVFYVHHEGQAQKGPNEVCSFLLHYINNFIDPEIKELHVFSDSCPGQNRNNTVTRFWLSLTDTERFQQIVHYFPIRGHSYLACDRNFSVVKRAIKKLDRIYTMKECLEIVVNSSAKGNFTGIMVDGEDILDFKSWWTTLYKKTAISLETSKREVPRDRKEQFSISKYHQFVYKSDVKGHVEVYEQLQGLVNHTFHLQLPGQLRPIVMPTNKAYRNGTVPIKKTKLEDIRKCVRYVAVHEDAVTFYENILQWPAKD